MKRALITGITGQDGSYLAELLVRKGYKVFGLIRRSSTDPLVRIQPLVSAGKITLIYGNLRDINAITRAIEESQPDEVYNLAALSDVGISFKCPEETFEVNYFGLGRIVIEAMRINPKVRIYQASTSEMFGKTPPPQAEDTIMQPVSPYAEAKLRAHEDYVIGYREKQGLFICSGILFNHESPLRGKHFVTRKITHSLAKINVGLQDVLTLGNLDTKRDWGFAGDYVEAMWRMLQQDEPEDYVISTGENHSVREFVEVAAKDLGMNITWEGSGLDEVGKTDDGKIIVKVSEKFYRPREVYDLCGDNTKARKNLDWEPRTNFSELVQMMTRADLKQAKLLKEGATQY